MIEIWGRASSSNVQKVLWLVGELGLEHRRIDVGGRFGGLDTQEFRAMNPNGLIPVLRDGDLVLWESHAILRYLAARYGPGSFWSEDPAVRAADDKWVEWAQSSLQPSFVRGVFWGFYRTPEAQRNQAAIARSVARCGQLFRQVGGLLEGRSYLGGESLSLADIVIGSMLYRYFTLEIERPALPRVEAWYQRLTARPAYRTHVMVPYDELFGRLSF